MKKGAHLGTPRVARLSLERYSKEQTTTEEIELGIKATFGFRMPHEGSFGRYDLAGIRAPRHSRQSSNLSTKQQRKSGREWQKETRGSLPRTSLIRR